MISEKAQRSTNQLKFLIQEMIHRIEEERNPCSLGEIGCLVPFAALVARRLGFHTPPVSVLSYFRDPKLRERDFKKFWLRNWPDDVSCSPSRACCEMQFAYEFSGPLWLDDRSVVIVTRLEDINPSGVRKMRDVLAETPKDREKQFAVVVLKRWLRTLSDPDGWIFLEGAQWQPWLYTASTCQASDAGARDPDTEAQPAPGPLQLTDLDFKILQYLATQPTKNKPTAECIAKAVLGSKGSAHGSFKNRLSKLAKAGYLRNGFKSREGAGYRITPEGKQILDARSGS